MRTIETPVVLTGRLAGPASPDEAVVTPAFVRSTGRGVGDTVTARLTTPEQASASLGGGPDNRPAGPAVRLSIVGVVRSLWYGGRGSLIRSPGLFDRYRAVLRSTVVRAAAQAGLPVPTLVGVRFALAPGRGANVVPARAALLGAVSGVLA
jgi:hypothetical protein